MNQTNTPIDILTWLLDYARAHGADACDAVMFKNTEIGTARRMGKPEGLERSENASLGLRVFCGQRSAIVSTTDTLRDTLQEAAQRAVAMARAGTADPYSSLAPEDRYCREVPDLGLLDSEEPTAEWLGEQCRLAEEAALSVEGITNSEGADAGYSRNQVALAIAGGNGVSFAQYYESSHFSVSVSVLAGSGTDMQSDYDFLSARHRNQLGDPASIGLNASHKALKRLHPRKVATCQVPVVFDPRISRSLLGMLAGAISGSAISRGSSFLKDKLHQGVFGRHITIVDDPHRQGGFGSKPFDAEGVQNGRRVIVDKGELTTWLLDMRSANKLGMQTTGNAARGVSSPPSPSSTNFYMEAGTASPQELIKDIKSGLYLTETFGHGANLVTGDFSQGAGGFWIENGEIAYPVSEITIAGHLSEMFASLTPANDLIFRYATNAPTLRIERMTVAGA